VPCAEGGGSVTRGRHVAAVRGGIVAAELKQLGVPSGLLTLSLPVDAVSHPGPSARGEGVPVELHLSELPPPAAPLARR
jgi:hypothetical protein